METLVNIQKLLHRRVTYHYNDLCSITTCPLRRPFSFKYLLHKASYKVIQISILVVVAMIVSSIGTIIRVRAQTTALAERVAIMESQQHMTEYEQTRMLNEVDALRAELVAEREKRAELDSRVSVMQGVGFGLGSIVMVLQAASMLLGLKRKNGEIR